MPEVVGRLPRLDGAHRSRGIYFADDPAFKGQRRELQAQDYVYAFQRIVDPANISPLETGHHRPGHRRACRTCATRRSKDKKPFDYDRPIDGLRALDRYTLQYHARQAAAALGRTRWPTPDLLGGAGARGGRALRRRHRRAPGGHRAVPAEELAAQLAHRARTQPGLPRGAATTPSRPPTTPRARPCWRASRAGACRWSTRSRSASSRSSSRSWLTFLNREVDALAGVTGQLPSQFANEAVPGGKLAPQPGPRRACRCTARWPPTRPSPTSTWRTR